MKDNKDRQEYGIFLDNDQLRNDAMQSKSLLSGIYDSAATGGAELMLCTKN